MSEGFSGGKLPDGDFLQLIRTAPLVAIDVILTDDSGRVLLAQRGDEPARGFYFVPGGRIFKDELISAAFGRILRSEVGLALRFEGAGLLGIYQHIYDTNRFEEPGTGTHYVVLAYQVAVPGQAKLAIEGPHRWAPPDEIAAMQDVHPFSKAYFSAAFRPLTAAC